MSSIAAGESRILKVFGAMRTSMTNAVRDLCVDGLSAHAAKQILDDVIAIEKAAAGLKLLVADRAAEGRGARSAADDLARRSGTSVGQARGVLETSRKVKAQPRVEDVLRDGALSEEQAAAIADAAAVNPAATGSLLDKARTEPLVGLREACGRAKAAADPDEDATQRRIHRERRLRTGTDAEGAFVGSFRMTTGDGASFMAHFQPFRDAAFKAAREEGRREQAEAYDVDALLAMAASAHANLTGGRAGDGAVKPPTQVHVVVNWDALVDGHRPGEDAAYIAGFGPVPVSLVREILDDAFLVGVVMKGTEVAKIKRFGRYVPLELRDALRIRDGFRCSTPGCNNWIRLERDHIVPYAQGGETSYGNLDHKCDVCHPEKTRRDRLFYDSG